ncbi:hypothetical protein EC2865200_5104 [Escherichia coli 2865200]|nr:hypothetical protein EC2865200_5104 [Escherichia coli 2865200]
MKTIKKTATHTTCYSRPMPQNQHKHYRSQTSLCFTETMR